MPAEENFQLFVTCASALEPLLLEELKELGIEDVKIGYRGVYVQGNWSTIYTINYNSRLASRVLLPLVRFKCYNRRSLYEQAYAIDWSAFLKPQSTFAIDANVHHRELRNSLFAAQVVKDAICDQMRHQTGRRPSVQLNNPTLQLNLFIQNEEAVISFDTSGAPLHKRGYRQETVEAPMQETLAAAILRLAQYNKEDVLFDPCCGSGTILVEAALIATQTSPGYLRHQWGFMCHPKYQTLEWLKVKNQWDIKRTILNPQRLFGIDLSKNAVRATRINLRAAGFQKEIEINEADFRNYTPTVSPNLIVTNPPHGRRLEEEDLLRPLYRALGAFLKEKTVKPARGFIFTGNLELTKEVGLATKQRHVLNSGGIDSRLLEFDIY